jgi:hypothetical protein
MSTINAFRQKHAARKIQRAVRRHLAKKYVMDHDGTMAINMITREPIHHSVAIDISTPSGLVRTWDALGLYDWFIKQNKKELRGFIHSLTPGQRARIEHLKKAVTQIHRAKIELQKKRLVRGRDVYNNVVRRSLQLVDTAADILLAILVTFIILNFLFFVVLFLDVWDPLVLVPALGLHYGSSAVVMGVSSARGFVIREHAIRSMKTLENRMEKLIDGIPLQHSNITLAEYLDTLSKREDFSEVIKNSSTRSKLLQVVEKARDLGL